MLQDLRIGLRTLTKNPGFTAVAVATLALGIGINAAIFSVVDGVLLRPLPYPEPDELVRIWMAEPTPGELHLEASYRELERLRDEAGAFRAMAAFSEAPRILRDDRGEPSHVTLARVSGGLISVLGVAPALGRDFAAEEHASGSPVVILGHRLWQGRYGGDPGILGRTVRIDADPHTVVGVLPEGITYPRTADLWRPLSAEEKEDDDAELSIVARLAPGATLDRADAEVASIARQGAAGDGSAAEESLRTAWVQALQATVVRDVRTPLLVLLGAVGLVLLIACANVANLLLARGLARQPEMALRTALGAGRRRIVRQLLTESALIAALGGGLGLWLGAGALRAITALAADQVPRLHEVALDGRVAGVMVAVTTLAGLLFGLAPALRSSRLDPHRALRGDLRGGSGGASKHRMRQGLVVAEVALATVLVIGAGLLIQSFAGLVDFERGFLADDVLVAPLSLRGQEDPRFAAFYAQALEQVAALPEVRSAALALRTPLEPGGFKFGFEVEGEVPSGRGGGAARAVLRPVSGEYFETVGIPLESGRTFDERDGAEAPRVAILNRTFARTLFPEGGAVGRRLGSDLIEGQGILVVGVAADVTPGPDVAEQPAVYVPFRQEPVPGASLLVHTAGDPLRLVPAVRARVRALDPNVPLDRIYTLEQRLAEAVAAPRLTMLLAGAFAALGLALAAVGIYGVMSYTVRERTREIGIRRALGADETGIVWTVVRQGMAMTALGLGIGLAAALAVSRLLAGLLFGITATDPATLATMTLVLATVAFLACYIPARRATKVDPLVAVRA